MPLDVRVCVRVYGILGVSDTCEVVTSEECVGTISLLFGSIALSGLNLKESLKTCH